MDLFFGLVALLFLSFFFLFFKLLFNFFILITLFLFYSLSSSFPPSLPLSLSLSFSLSLFLSFFFFLPFLQSCVADMVFVLQPGVRYVPLRWERRVQNIGAPKTSQLHIISNGKSYPRDLHLKAKTQLYSTTSKLQCWIPYAKQLARQENKPAH